MKDDKTMNEKEDNIQNVLKEISEEIIDAFTQLPQKITEHIKNATLMSSDYVYCLEYFYNHDMAEEEQHKEKLRGLVEHICIMYAALEPEFEIPVNMVFDLYDVDVEKVIVEYSKNQYQSRDDIEAEPRETQADEVRKSLLE